MNKINPSVARLDRFARRVGLDLTEPAVNRRGFTYRPTGRYLEFKPGGKGILQVTSYLIRGGLREAVAYRTVDQMETLMFRASEVEPLIYQSEE